MKRRREKPLHKWPAAVLAEWICQRAFLSRPSEAELFWIYYFQTSSRIFARQDALLVKMTQCDLKTSKGRLQRAKLTVEWDRLSAAWDRLNKQGDRRRAAEDKARIAGATCATTGSST